MFHASDENRLYNFTQGTQTDIILKSKNVEIDLNEFLDDISTWMENHKEVIFEKYVPFSCLAVGLTPSQSSAFVYGCFVGRSMEKNKVLIDSKMGPIDKKNITKQIREDIKSQMGYLGNVLEEMNLIDEKGDDNEEV